MTKSHKHIALVAAFLVAAPAAVAGQEHQVEKGVRPSAPASFCFNGARQSKCATFVIAEMQGSTPLIQSTRAVSWGDAPVELGHFDERLAWELGLMHNVSDRWAVGGTARLGSGSAGALRALSARARRWMSDVVAVEVSAGASYEEDTYPNGPKVDFTADARLNFRDDAYVGLRYDQVGLPSTRNEWGGFDAGGEQRALSLLAGVGSEWALGGSAAAGLGMILLLALVDWE